MTIDTEIIEKAKSRIRFLLRQADGGTIPKQVPMTPALRELVDMPTAQRLYEEIIIELDKSSNVYLEGDLNNSSDFVWLSKLAQEIKAQGYDDKTATKFARLIGDTPYTDDTGAVVIIDDNGKELARLKLNFYKRI